MCWGEERSRAEAEDFNIAWLMKGRAEEDKSYLEYAPLSLAYITSFLLGTFFPFPRLHTHLRSLLPLGSPPVLLCLGQGLLLPHCSPCCPPHSLYHLDQQIPSCVSGSTTNLRVICLGHHCAPSTKHSVWWVCS